MDLDNELLDLHPIHPEAEELIRSNWADRVAYGIAGDNPEWHNYVADLAQEARLVMWHAAEKFDPAATPDIVSFCKQRGRWMILSVVSGHRNFTGGDHTRGVPQKRGDEARARLLSVQAELKQAYGREPTLTELSHALELNKSTVHYQLKTIANLPGVANPSVVSLEGLLTAAANENALGSSETDLSLVYHYGEIHEALRDLPPLWREYIWLRFWEGWSEAELHQLGNHTHWEQIQSVLAEKLGHLIGVT